jgi:hypothetical protein
MLPSSGGDAGGRGDAVRVGCKPRRPRRAKEACRWWCCWLLPFLLEYERSRPYPTSSFPTRISLISLFPLFIALPKKNQMTSPGSLNQPGHSCIYAFSIGQ